MIEGNVLVLNRSFQVIQTTSIKRALVLLFGERAKVVDHEYRTYSFEEWVDVPVQADDPYIATPHSKVAVPFVIQLLNYDKMPKQQMKFSRGNVYLRDQNKCQYCRKRYATSELSLDHVIPISRGGKSTWENVVCACLPCNVKKGNLLLSECHLQLMKAPVRPRWHPLHKMRKNAIPKMWRTFLDEAYWNVELKE